MVLSNLLVAFACNLTGVAEDPRLEVLVTNRDGHPVVAAIYLLAAEAELGEPRLLTRGRPLRTDAEGRWSGSVARVGPILVRAWIRGFRTAQKQVELEADATHTVTLVMERGATVEVWLLSPDRGPAEGVDGFICDQDGHSSERGKSDAEGKLRIACVRTGERVSLCLRPRDYELAEIEIEPLQEGEIRELGVHVLKRGASVQGTVRDDRGLPIEGAKVWLSWPLPADESRARSPVVTGRDGVYAFRGLKAGGPYFIQCSAPGHEELSTSAGARDACELHLGEDEVVRTDLTLARENVHRGVVRFADGRPAEGATVKIEILEGSGFARAVRCGVGGVFSLPALPPGRTRMTVEDRKRNLTRVLRADALEELPTEITLPDGAHLVVEIQVPEGTALPAEIDVLGGAPLVDGRAHFHHLEPGTYKLRVTASGYEPSDTKMVTLEAGITTPLTFMLRPVVEKTLRLRVVDRDGRGVPGATVGMNQATTDERGEVSVTYTSETRVLSVVKEGLVLPGGFVRLQDVGETAEVRLEPESRVAVIITDHTGAPECVSISLRGSKDAADGETGNDGQTMLEGLPPGDYELQVSERPRVLMRETVHLEAGDQTIRRQLPPAIEVAGTVSVEGRAVRSGHVDINRSPGRAGGWWDVDVDATGRFRTAVYEEGAYLLNFRAPGYDTGGPEVAARLPVYEPIEITVPVGNELRLDFERINVHRLTGRVCDPGGYPLPWVQVALGSGQRVTTDAGGQFRFEHLPPGEVRFWVKGLPESLFSKEETVRIAGDTVHDPRIEAAQRVTILIENPDSQKLLATLDPWQATGSLYMGRQHEFTVSLPEGCHRLKIGEQGEELHLGGWVDLQVPVREQPVRVRLSRGVTVWVVVQDAQGIGVAGARVECEPRVRCELGLPAGGLETNGWGACYPLLPPGEHVIRATLPDGSVLRGAVTVEVPPPPRRGWLSSQQPSLVLAPNR
ncbi:MAG: carboxypeptidase regulatory-like domain-containing protein [Planctomycetota bacterium]